MGEEKEKYQAVIDSTLEVYPEKTRKEREKHIAIMQNDPGIKDVPKSNKKTRPGVMTTRGCAYAGSKGVVWGPIKDVVHISHGPVGCGQYSWAARRNYYNGIAGINSFVTMQFTSDFQENDIVFGGDKKLGEIIDEIEGLFPLNKGISIQSECPVGLIGDDIEAVAKKKSSQYNKPIIPVRCEGFRGISQSLGHHIANDAIKDNIYEKALQGTEIESSKYDVALIGDYNIGGDAWASRKIFDDMGLNLISQSTGDSTINEIKNLSRAKIVLIHCYRSMNYIARYIEDKFGIPWVEFNFFGPTEIFESMRKIAGYFDEKVRERTEFLINEVYKPYTDSIIAEFTPKLKGKKVMLYVGGLRPRHTIPAFKDLGMEIYITGYEFAHNDDYERTKAYLQDATLVVDDMTEFEMEKFLKAFKPDMFGSGVKEKYQTQKLGIPFRQMHSWDYSGPYHGIDGFAVFSRDMDMTINGPIWKKVEAPWKAQE